MRRRLNYLVSSPVQERKIPLAVQKYMNKAAGKWPCTRHEAGVGNNVHANCSIGGSVALFKQFQNCLGQMACLLLCTCLRCAHVFCYSL